MLETIKKFGLWWERLRNFWTKWAYFMIGDGYFYVGRVIIVTVFP